MIILYKKNPTADSTRQPFNRIIRLIKPILLYINPLKLLCNCLFRYNEMKIVSLNLITIYAIAVHTRNWFSNFETVNISLGILSIFILNFLTKQNCQRFLSEMSHNLISCMYSEFVLEKKEPNNPQTCSRECYRNVYKSIDTQSQFWRVNSILCAMVLPYHLYN